MDSKDEIKSINIKNCARYYFDDTIKDFDINFDIILLIFQFLTFQTKIQQILDCVLGFIE